MPNPEKPRHRSGYKGEDLEQVTSACLTVAVTLGAYMDDLCIVGGLVPALLIDAKRPESSERHPGTNDLDIGLALGLLDDERYAEVSARLRAEGFSPDVNESGNETVQRWRLGDRTEPKDAFDLVYVIRRTPGQGINIAERLAAHVEHHRDAVEGALASLKLNFGTPDSLGAGRAADFVLVDPADRDGEAADAHGYVDDLLAACRKQGLTVG